MSHKTYLSGFTTCLGERRPIAELPQLREDANVAAYLAKSGFESYRRSAQSPAHMAEQCLRALKEKLPQRFARIDAIVYASVTVSDGRFFNEHLGEALCAVGLGQTNLTGLFASQCGNLGNALMLARMMILTGQAACVLVVVTDACMDERQRVYDGNVVVSDGAVVRCGSLVTGRTLTVSGAVAAG